jgi:hypothetical protein
MFALALAALPLVWICTSLGRRLFLISSAPYRWAGGGVSSVAAVMPSLKGLRARESARQL